MPILSLLPRLRHITELSPPLLAIDFRATVAAAFIIASPSAHGADRNISSIVV
jgi:hypothetical protein